MNAAGQRRLTPWLLAACVLLAAVWVTFLLGVGRTVRWKPPREAHPLPVGHRTAVTRPTSLDHYANIWQHPLFAPGRLPLSPATGSEHHKGLDNFVLTGVILAPGMQMALLRDRGDGHAVRVLEGAHLADSDWVLKTLKRRSAVFVDKGQRRRLALKVPASADNAQGFGHKPTETGATGESANKSIRADGRAQTRSGRHARARTNNRQSGQRRSHYAAAAGEH